MKGVAKKLLNSLTGKLSIVLPAKFEVEAEVAVPLIRGNHVLPVNIDTISMPLQGNFDVVFELPEVYVYELKNVCVRYDGIIYKNFSVFEPSLPAYWFKASFEYAPLLKQYYKAEKVNTDKDPIIVFHDMWSDNYYHWLIDALPRLLLLDSSKKKYRVGIPYYNSTKDYVKLTVNALGFTNHYIFQLDQTVSVDRVILPGRTAYGIDQNPTLLRSLREKLVAALEVNKVQAHRNIFVSRGRAKTRRLKNEHEIISTLIKHNFEIVYFEELSFLEQFMLMRETKIMVGVHGANLANSLFMQPGCVLVELINREHPNLVYYHMASSLQLSYFSIPCVPDSVSPQTGDSSKIFDPNLNNADYCVEPGLFSAILNECVKYAN